MNLKSSFVCVAMLFAVSGFALANNAAVDVGQGSFADQRAKIEADLADGETYSEISKGDRATVASELAKMEALLRGRSVSELSEAEKVELINSQEVVNTRLTKASEDSRMVCRREPVAGTRLPRSQCLTVAERRRQREQSQDAIQAHNRGFAPIGEP